MSRLIIYQVPGNKLDYKCDALPNPKDTEISVPRHSTSPPSWWCASEASHFLHRKQSMLLLVILQHLATIPLHPAIRRSIKSCISPHDSTPGPQRPLRCLLDRGRGGQHGCSRGGQDLYRAAEQGPQQRAPGSCALLQFAGYNHLGHLGSKLMLQNMLQRKATMSRCRTHTTFDRLLGRRSVISSCYRQHSANLSSTNDVFVAVTL